MKTIAAVLVELNRPLELMELDVPALKKGQVLVKLAFSGICRTQINEIKGFKGKDAYLPHTLGHEGSGVVLEVGEGVTKVAVGDHVIATWIKGGGLEPPNTLYQSAIGTVNAGAISTFMHHAVIAENRLVVIPKQFSLKLAALFGCAIPTGAGIVFNDLNMPAGSSIAVFGAGGIGLSSILAASARGAKTIIAIDTEEVKLELAKRLGATHCVNADQPDVLASIRDIVGTSGVDFAVEAAGHKKVMEMAFKSVREKGGVCVIAGNTPQGVCIECDPFDFIKGRKLMGTWGGNVFPDRDLPLFIEHFKQAEELISHVASLDAVNELITLVDERKAARAFIEL